ncbi:CaiB/BaiF CoA transferase family protein [Rhodopila sp.]|jgi:crotonobetainyl-CoA:carnitine CoA-transferase CaiB-like acyl-CoA transferase|uniref:CaiB/BaiF CoA transferase family protein n=1 Tax=Rhodopila sp. TaxID=2480087 RepID=UPI002BDC0986|nr:CoA transferase [Rhodopila sp.]HVZ08927.1 CoA transferase [Rhodopila sp.]
MAGPRALQGIRVVDFSWVRAGPWATRWLGALGAEIIKIEWPENERGRLPSSTTPKHLETNLNTSGNFADTNVNKKSLSLNVRSEKGLAIVKRLIAISDIVIENFSSRVLQKWGLGYEELCRIKPDIVYVSMSGYGHTGRNHHYTTFGPVAQAASGLTFQSGLPGQPPAGWGWSYMDDTGGMYGAMCALTGLYHRNVTGKGQHIDQSQMISAVPLNGPVLLDFTVNGRGTRRPGFPPGNRAYWPGTPMANAGRGPTVAPHNAYRTHPGGYNDWCVIVCHDDAEWRALVQVMGSSDWAASDRFATAAARLHHQDELDSHIEAWTQTLGKYEVTERCQAAGVRAMPVQSAEDRVEHDPQLRHRRLYRPIEHPALGTYKAQNAPFTMSATPVFNHAPAPMIGQHTQEIVEGLLGLGHDELRAGFEDGTFWPARRARFPYQEEMLR